MESGGGNPSPTPELISLPIAHCMFESCEYCRNSKQSCVWCGEAGCGDWRVMVMMGSWWQTFPGSVITLLALHWRHYNNWYTLSNFSHLKLTPFMSDPTFNVQLRYTMWKKMQRDYNWTKTPEVDRVSFRNSKFDSGQNRTEDLRPV